MYFDSSREDYDLRLHALLKAVKLRGLMLHTWSSELVRVRRPNVQNPSLRPSSARAAWPLSALSLRTARAAAHSQHTPRELRIGKNLQDLDSRLREVDQYHYYQDFFQYLDRARLGARSQSLDRGPCGPAKFRDFWCQKVKTL